MKTAKPPKKSSKTTKKPLKTTKKIKTPAKKLGQCGVCLDDFENEKDIVACPFCPSKNCIGCSQDYLLSGSRSVPHGECMTCKKEWPSTFFSATFPKDFRLGPYLENRKKKLLEEQTAALPATMPIMEAKKKEEALKEEGKEIRKMLEETRKKIAELDEQLRANEQIIKNGVAAGAKKTYMFKCPRVGADEQQCRGFIEKDTFSCTLCKTQICKDCHAVIEENTKHLTCKKEDIETAKMVLADTKPCPVCSARIFKIHGCDQMFCTQCQTAFSWTTGNIETGAIHNPHYYELMRKLGNNRRAAGDVPCGGLVAATQLFGYIDGYYLDDVIKIHRRCGEIITYIRNRNGEVLNYEDIRVNYLMGKLTDVQFRDFLFERSCLIEKRREELQILSTFEVAVIERLNKLVEDAREVWSRKVLRADYEKDDDSDSVDEDADYEKKTVVQLKDILRRRGLALTGLKHDLVQRLFDADRGIVRVNEDTAKKQVRRHHRRGKVRASVKKGSTSKTKVKSEYMLIPLNERRKLIIDLFAGVIKEVRKVVEFCNSAFKDSFTALGYEEYPVLDLNEEYKFSSKPEKKKSAAPRKLTLEEIVQRSNFRRI